MPEMVPPKGYVNVGIRASLMERVQRFVDHNTLGYSNRSQVVRAAIQEFLLKHEPVA